MKWLLGGLLVAGFLLWWPTAGTPLVLRWLAVGLLGGLLVYSAVERGLRPTLPLLASLALLGWLALSLTWSLDPAHGALGLLKIAALWLVFWGAGALRHVLAPAAMAGLCVALLLFFIFPGIWGGFGNGNWAAAWVMLALPIAGVWCWSQRTVLPSVTMLGVLALSGVWVVFRSGSDAWILVAWVCGLAWLVSIRWWWTAAMAAVVSINAGLLWAPESITVALTRRAEMWINSAAAWLDAPFFGHGLGSFNDVYDRFREVHVSYMPGYETRLHPITMSAGEAHNEALQILVEFGLVGLILAAFFVWSVVRQEVDEPVARACKWSLLIAGSLALISSPLQSPASIVLIAASLGLVVGSPSRQASLLSVALPGSMFTRSHRRAF